MKRRSFLKGTLATAPLLLSSPPRSRRMKQERRAAACRTTSAQHDEGAYLLPILSGVRRCRS